ncbi:MAG: methyltransferase domain-containing protein [Clostridiales bacterium]|nr:methyltransferase domain-containing protein [Clostridiales bacterium]
MEDLYDVLADHYDLMQEEIDPEELGSLINSLVEKHLKTEEKGRSLVDLGCGSGSVTAVLAEKYGYDATGIDRSDEMLMEASAKSSKVMWVNQDITDYELPGMADVFISTTNTMNHITDRSLFGKILKSFETYMLRGGLFIFDVGTEEHFTKTLADNVFYEDYDDMTMLWTNSYDEKEKLSTAEITVFYTEDGENYKRTDGELYERFYPEDEIKKMAEQYGLEFVEGMISDDRQREYIVLRRK